MRKIVLNILVFLSAFLLFQIELIIAKILLPEFGGSYLVWGVCVVFFQGALLAGYLYAHIVLQKIGILRYRLIHLLLAAIPLLVFPGRPLPGILPNTHIPLAADVSLQLLRTVGIAFFVLSTTSIIFQSWFAHSEMPDRDNPYFLYAVSNFGAFVALLTYPFIFEAFLDLDIQLVLWRIGYLLFFLLNLVVFCSLKIKKESVSGENKPLPRVKLGRQAWSWVLLGAAGSIMFLSVTNIITYEIAPIPLLWIIPLCIYLGSFVLVFKRNPWCPAWIEKKFILWGGFSVLLYFFSIKGILPFALLTILFFAALFIISMFCQIQLYNRRPQDRRQLTDFYLLISLGSFIGGFLVSWIMPLVSPSMVEYLLGIFFIALAMNIGQKKELLGAYMMRLIIYAIINLMLWPFLFKGYNVFGMVIIILCFKFILTEFKGSFRVFQFYILAIIVTFPALGSFWAKYDNLFERRNYYGIYKAYYKNGKTMLLNGTTIHGAQYINPRKASWPLTYYHPDTPVGEFLSQEGKYLRCIGIIGLGAGTLATYFEKGQEVDFYELDPDVYTIASDYFTYLKQDKSKVNVIFGDARMSLKKNKRPYDILIVDAFSGDSVPVHLLTTQAISEYRRNLIEGGVILFHISNRYLDLMPVLAANAPFLNGQSCYKKNQVTGDAFASTWVALTWDRGMFYKLTNKFKWMPTEKRRGFRVWTDKYSNTLSVLRIQDLLYSIRDFTPFYW